MNNRDFNTLVGPVNMLIGFAQSAIELTERSDLKNWRQRLVELANAAEKAWIEVVIQDRAPGKTD